MERLFVEHVRICICLLCQLGSEVQFMSGLYLLVAPFAESIKLNRPTCDLKINHVFLLQQVKILL